jgi:hypothetical protein
MPEGIMRARSFSLWIVLMPSWPAVPAAAQDVSFPDLAETVAGHGSVTYLDLARMVVPDLAEKDGAYVGSVPVAMRDLSGDAEAAAAPEATSLFNAAALEIHAGGKDRLLLLFDLGQAQDSAEGYAPLALYDLGGEPKLLDVANVASDRSTYFRDPGKFAIGAGDDAVTTMSMHFNSNQTYMTTDLITVQDDRLALVDSIFTLDEQSCAYERTQQLSFSSGTGDTYPPIIATVTDATEPTAEACDEVLPARATKNIVVTYRWDVGKARYMPDSDAFMKLANEDEKRF